MNASNNSIFSAHTRASRQPRFASVHTDAEIPPLLHGNYWCGQNVAGYWCSEKFDGWRAYWTGTRLVSRQGKDYGSPAWFTAGLPDYPLDGELWLGRGKGDTDVHRAIAAGEWSRIRLAVVDVPGLVAEQAIDTLRNLELGPYAFAADFFQVQSTVAARAAMLAVVEQGGEGVMLRKPGTIYRNTRTDDLLKLKSGRISA